MSLVYIKGLKSTANKPFRFFTELININPLALAIQSFQEQLPNTSESSFNLYPLIGIANDRLSFTIEINSDNDGYVDEFGNWIRLPSKIWIEKTYTFRDELKKHLKWEFNNSCNYLNDKWEEHGYDKNTPGWFKKNVIELVNCVKIIEQNEDLKEYRNEFSMPYKELIRYIYLKYGAFVPKKYSDNKIGEILKSSVKSAPLYSPYKIKSILYRSIAYYEDKYSNSFFGFEEPSKIEESLKLFAAKRINEISTPINFTKKAKAAYYLIHQLHHLIDMNVNEIKNTNVLFFKGKPFTRTSYDTNLTRISERDKEAIDTLLGDCLM